MKTPQLSEASLRDILEDNNVDQSKVCVLAVRGYYLDSMGKPGANDRRIYDDAMFIIWPDGVARFQANTDPNGWRKGRGTGSQKGMAMLKTGIHRYGKGKHRNYAAFRQAERFTVTRDGITPYDDLGWHAINLHSGGNTSTSSLGCQTVPKSTWNTFRTILYDLIESYGNPMGHTDHGKARVFDYVLIDETERRKGNLIVSHRYL